MLSNEVLLFILFSYLTGAFPSAVWVGKFFYRLDVREYGSGNAGATNTFRVLGKKAGIPVLIMDILKGWLSVYYIHFLSNLSVLEQGNPEIYFEIQLLFGISAVIGHLFPVFTGFRGGKGIATMLGILIGLYFQAAILSFLFFIVILLITRYVSLASILSSCAFPLIVIILFESSNTSLNIFSVFIPILSLITHQKNIERLIRGEETKVTFEKK